MARSVGWGAANVGWPNQGHSFMYSPPGVEAPRDLINRDMGTGVYYDRGRLAPPEGRTLSLVPAGYRMGSMQGVGQGDDGDVGYGDGPDDGSDLLSQLDDTTTPTPTPAATPTADAGTAAAPDAGQQPAAPSGADSWDPAKYIITPPNAAGIQYALDQNTQVAVGIAAIKGKPYSPSQQDEAQQALQKVTSASQNRAASEWINKSTLPNKTEIGQDPQSKKWYYRTPKGQVGEWDAAKGAPADGGGAGSGGQDFGQGGSSTAASDLQRYGAAVSQLTGNPEAGRFAMAQALKEGTAGGAFPMGPNGPYSATYNYGGWGGVGDSNPGHPAYQTPEAAAQGWVDFVNVNGNYKPLAAVIANHGSAEDMANAMATTSAGMWSESHDAQGHNPAYAQGILGQLGNLQMGSDGNWTVTGNMPSAPAGGRAASSGAGNPGIPGSYPVEYTDANGQTHVHWVTPDRLHYGSDTKGAYSYDPNTGHKTYISDAGPGQNVLSVGDQLVNIGGTSTDPTATPIYTAPPTYSSDQFAGGLYNFNPQTGKHTLEAQGPYDVGGEMFLPPDMMSGYQAAIAPGNTKIQNQLAGWKQFGAAGVGDDMDGNPFYGWGDDGSDPQDMDTSDFAALGQGDQPAPPVNPAAVEGMGTKPGETGLLGQPHHGIDVQAQKGTPVVAPENGVIHIEKHRTGGLVVYVIGQSGKRYKMAHLDAASVQEGQKVKKGQPVGKVGESGTAATGPNLHFEMQNPDGSQRNPQEALGAMANMPPSPNTVGAGEDKAFGLDRVPPMSMQLLPPPGPPQARPQQPRVGWGDAGGDWGETMALNAPGASTPGGGTQPGAFGPGQPGGQGAYTASGSIPGYQYVPSGTQAYGPGVTGGGSLGYNLGAAGLDPYTQIYQQQLQNSIAQQQAQLAFEQANALGFIGGQPTTTEQQISGNLPNGNPTLSKQQLYGGTSSDPTLDAMNAQGFVFGKPTVAEQQLYQQQLMSALNNPWVQALTGMAPGVGLPGGPAAFGGTANGPNPIVQQVGGGDDADVMEGEYASGPSKRVGWGDAQTLALNAVTPLTGGAVPTTNTVTPASSSSVSNGGFGVATAPGTGTSGGNGSSGSSLGFEQPLTSAFTAPQQSAAFQNSGSLTGGATTGGSSSNQAYNLSSTGAPLAPIAAVAATPDAPATPGTPTALPSIMTVWGPYDPNAPEWSPQNNPSIRRLVLNQYIANGGEGPGSGKTLLNGVNTNSLNDQQVASLVNDYMATHGPLTAGTPAVAGTPGTPGMPGAPGAVNWQTWQSWTPFQQAAWLTNNMASGWSQGQALAGEQNALASQGVTQAPDVTQLTYGTLSPLQQQAYGNTAAVFGLTPQAWLANQQRHWAAGQAVPVQAVGWA